MQRLHTRWVVAMVQNMNIIADRPMVKLVRYTMGANEMAIVSKLAIAEISCRAGPQPAIRGFANAAPERAPDRTEDLVGKEFVERMLTVPTRAMGYGLCHGKETSNRKS